MFKMVIITLNSRVDVVSLEPQLTCLLLPQPLCLPVFSVSACCPDPWPLGQQPDSIYPYWCYCPPTLLPHPCDLGKDVRREDHFQVSSGNLGQKGTMVVTTWSWQCHDMSCWCKSLPHPQASYRQGLSWRLLLLKGQLPTTGLKVGPVGKENVWLDSPVPYWDMTYYLVPEAEVLWLVGRGTQRWQAQHWVIGWRNSDGWLCAPGNITLNRKCKTPWYGGGGGGGEITKKGKYFIFWYLYIFVLL